MVRALAFVLVAGVVIGLAWPSANPPAQAVVEDSGQVRDTVLEREGNGHFFVHAKVNGELARFLVDTGASYVALTIDDAERLKVPFSPAEFTYIGEGASGPVRGQLVTIKQIEIDGKRVDNVRGAVLEGSDLSLLGQSYLSRIAEVHISGDTMVLR